MSQQELRYDTIPRGQRAIAHATGADTLADVLERVLDKGVVIAGDIMIKLCDVELLTIHLRLLVASVERAKEMGIDWWEYNPFLSSRALEREEKRKLAEKEEEIEALKKKIEQLGSSIPQDSHNRAKREPRRRRKDGDHLG